MENKIALETILPYSIVSPIGTPEKRGVVLSAESLGNRIKYIVFLDNAERTFYSGQIKLASSESGIHWVNPLIFRNRLSAYQINHPSSTSLYSLNSARIDFVPYQFRPALKLIHSDLPRLLIADSVGVGKTIEAGLILKELEARGNLERVLIICPKPLVAERKWELEMKRFDEDFIPLDGTAFRQLLADTDRDGEWPSRYNRVIVPYSILDSRALGTSGKKRGAFGLSALQPPPHFDLVIVDEAHHIRNGSMESEKAFAYKCVKIFCDAADAVILLTATPLQTSNRDLFTLLNLIRPDVVIDQRIFEAMAQPNEYIHRAARYIRAGEAHWREDAKQELLGIPNTQWGKNIIVRNPLYQKILKTLDEENIDREKRIQMVSDVEVMSSFHTMINRTRRRDIQDFCIRRSYTISTNFTLYQRQLYDALFEFETNALAMLHDVRTIPFMISTLRRQTASCIFGLSGFLKEMIARRFAQINDDPEIDPNDLQMDEKSSGMLERLAKQVLLLAEHIPDDDPKFDRMLTLIHEKQRYENNKIMIFSAFRHTLSYLLGKLERQGFRVAQVDGSVKDESRYQLKDRFSLPRNQPNALDILLFTEVGSEGLDYQFCDMIINYDLPWNPMRIEQRIGRIDRRGQQSEAVNIYNIITEGTVDADIYYRCLLRIGVFERSIGDCEVILGEMAEKIEKLAVDTSLTAEERRKKLEQIADNDIRKMQELERLEEEEKNLFGFDLSEFTTEREIRQAESPWLSPENLRHMAEQYIQERTGVDVAFFGKGSLKNLRLSRSARRTLLSDLNQLSMKKSVLQRDWEQYLKGGNPNHAAVFDTEAARENRDAFFFTPTHPLIRQAAAHFAGKDTIGLRIESHSIEIPEGEYPFSVYAWRYLGLTTRFRLITVCEESRVAELLPKLLETAQEAPQPESERKYDWKTLEIKQMAMWDEEVSKHKSQAMEDADYKIESIGSFHRNRIRSLEERFNSTLNESMRRMYTVQREKEEDEYRKKVEEIKTAVARADIHTELLANGVVVITRG